MGLKGRRLVTVELHSRVSISDPRLNSLTLYATYTNTAGSASADVNGSILNKVQYRVRVSRANDQKKGPLWTPRVVQVGQEKIIEVHPDP